MSRDNRAALAHQTLAILECGSYQTPSGRTVNISQPLAAAIQNTRLYTPADFPAQMGAAAQGAEQARREVTPETTLQAAHRLALAMPNDDALCLNFASAKNPGGGFLGGSQAQEESLARSSGLYACLLPQTEMYAHNRRLATGLYSDYMIYSPRVPVFRDDAGLLLEHPYTVSFLTAPAVNAGAVRRNEPSKISRIRQTLEDRAGKLLWIASRHNHKTLVLGAWGCGVFENDPAMIADIFRSQLTQGGRYAGLFAHIVFAIYDKSKNQEVFNAFHNALSMSDI